MNDMNQELKDSSLKTGTTILGIVCKDGVVMASDRQVTLGERIVANKTLTKTNKINDYLVISWAGSLSDAQRLSKILPAELKLKELRSKSRPTVKQAAHLTSNILYSGARQGGMIVGTLVGGFDADGSTELYSITPDGSVFKVEDYDASIGSGMTYVLGLFERQYKKGLTVKDGVELAQEALKSSTQRDVGSGYGIDVFTITKEGIKKVVDQEIVSEYKNRN